MGDSIPLEYRTDITPRVTTTAKWAVIASFGAYVLIAAFFWWLESASDTLQATLLVASLSFETIGLVLSIVAVTRRSTRSSLAWLGFISSATYAAIFGALSIIARMLVF